MGVGLGQLVKSEHGEKAVGGDDESAPETEGGEFTSGGGAVGGAAAKTEQFAGLFDGEGGGQGVSDI